MRLTRQQILDAADLVSRPVPVPEWGGSGAEVLVWGVSADEITRWELSRVDARDEDRPQFMASLAALTVRDESGVRLFSDADAAALAGKSARAIYRVFRQAQRLNGLRSSDVGEIETAAAASAEGLAKN